MDVIEALKAKYKITSETEAFLTSYLDILRGIPDGKIEELARNKYDEAHGDFNKKIVADFDGSVKQFHVPSATNPAGVLIDVMKPKDAARRPGILINFHGGGTMASSRKADEPVCMMLARELKCVVVNVEFRLPPDYKFPAMFDDGKAVVRWILMNKSLMGGENDSKVGVIGSGLGGGIAATCAFEVPGIEYQILVYPFVDWRCEGKTFEEFELNGCSTNMSSYVKQAIEQCLRSDSDKSNPRASPLLRKDFSGLPPTLIFLAEIDPFREAIYEFKTKVKAAGVPCESKLMKGAIHAFFSLPGLFQETNQRTREIIAQFYKKNGVSS